MMPATAPVEDPTPTIQPATHRQRTASENDLPDTSAPSPTGRNSLSSSSPARTVADKTNAQAYTTEIIKALFGRDGSAGVVVGDYACSYQRQSGRLYVSTGALFFYSNLFGFERRIRVQYDQLSEISITRTTSLYLKTSEGEEHVFRSFQDRDAVLEVIQRFHGIKSTPSKTEVSKLFDTTRDTVDKDGDATKSDSKSEEQSQKLAAPKELFREQSALTNSLENTSFDELKSSDSTESPWENVKQSARKSLKDEAVSNFKLSFPSAKEFFSQFLSDGAPNSLSLFHQKIIGDNNVTITNWETSDTAEDIEADEAFIRVLKFEHKSKLSVAQVTRCQTYQCHGNNACLRNVTKLKGVPSADAFFVEDVWLIESTGEGDILLNIRFHTHFSKSTMIRSIIESRSRAETLEWYGKYTSFLKNSTQQLSSEADNEKASTTIEDKGKEKEEASSIQSSYFDDIVFHVDRLARQPNLLMIVIIVWLGLIVLQLRRRVMILEGVTDHLLTRLSQIEDQELLRRVGGDEAEVGSFDL